MAWESPVQERETEKADKYQELVADLAHTWEGFRVLVVPVVVGTLGLSVVSGATSGGASSSTLRGCQV